MRPRDFQRLRRAERRIQFRSAISSRARGHRSWLVKRLQVVEHGVAQALGVIAVGNVRLLQAAREDPFKERRDILRLLPPFGQHLVHDVALFEEREPFLGARRCGLQTHQALREILKRALQKCL